MGYGTTAPARGGPRGVRGRWLLVAVVVVALLAVAVLSGAAARALTYHPDPTPVGPVGERLGTGEDVVLRTEDGLDLDAWLLHPPDEDSGVAVLYLPGNGGNRASRLGVGEEIARRGFTVLLVDYRGYGGNPGTPSEEGLARDARAAAAFLRDRGFDPARTLYVGESIGTGVAAQLTVTDPPAAVLLRSPFPSLAALASTHYPRPLTSLLLREGYRSADALRDSEVPVLVLHGDADGIVPSRLSADLAAEVGTLHDEVVLPGVGHNDAVWFGPVLADAVVGLAGATVLDAGTPGAGPAG